MVSLSGERLGSLVIKPMAMPLTMPLIGTPAAIRERINGDHDIAKVVTAFVVGDFDSNINLFDGVGITALEVIDAVRRRITICF